MRRVTPRAALIRRLAPWGAAGLATAVLATALTVSVVKYAPPPPALIPLRDAAVRDVVRVTAAAGLRLETLTVEGRDRTTADDLLAAMDVSRGSPILTIDLAEARDGHRDLAMGESGPGRAAIARHRARGDPGTSAVRVMAAGQPVYAC